MFSVMSGKCNFSIFIARSSGRLITLCVTGAMCFMLVLILDMQPLCLKDQSKMIDSIMIFFPHYALGSGMKNIYSSYEYNQICDFQKNGNFLSSYCALFTVLVRKKNALI